MGHRDSGMSDFCSIDLDLLPLPALLPSGRKRDRSALAAIAISNPRHDKNTEIWIKSADNWHSERASAGSKLYIEIKNRPRSGCDIQGCWCFQPSCHSFRAPLNVPNNCLHSSMKAFFLPYSFHRHQEDIPSRGPSSYRSISSPCARPL
jgi:hypothetical protein